VKAVGPTGHGSRFIENTAMGKLVEVCRKALSFRDEQETELGHTGTLLQLIFCRVLPCLVTLA
jgi:hypothetical protein